MQKHTSLTEQAHNIINQSLAKGDIAIDATLGNGHDTLFLARQVGKQGIVYGFDIQHQAIEATRSRLESNNISANIKLMHVNHSQMEAYIPAQYQGKIKAIMFNLGYLPGSDRAIITQTDTTLFALNKSIMLLSPGGIISISAYPGHAGGKTESIRITKWCKQLNPEQYSTKIIYCSTKDKAPRLFIINKLFRVHS